LFVDFFGVKASTYKSIGLLAMEHGAPIVVGCARRTSEKFRYEIDCDRVIMPEEWQGRADPLMWITQEYSAALERLIRVAPEQYLWMHRRWKSRPKGEEMPPSGVVECASADADSRDEEDVTLV
jgi:KDO2-lipid IV(A) lauroyltransferase